MFSLSVDDMLRNEALVVLKNLSRLMATKLEELLSHICGWGNSWISIAVARSYSRTIQGDFPLSPLQYRELD